MKKVVTLFLVLALVLSLAACGAAPNETSTPKANISITDSRGKTVSFETQPQKIISLAPANTEILYALGAGDRVIAVSEYCNYPEDTQGKQKLPTGENLNMESVLALKPDAVFMGKMSVMNEQIQQMEDAGIKVVVTEANSIDETYKSIRLMGKAVGKEKEAEQIVENMEKGFASIREQVKGKTAKTVYVEVSPLQFGLWSCGKNTFIQELIEIVGAKNIFEDVEGWSAVSEEQVLARNPEIIFTTASPITGIEDPVGEIVSRSQWNTLEAVKNNKVIMLDADMISRPGPRLLDAAQEMVKAIYQ
jgi:iron complex transport system substrate-binding protein